MSFRFGRISFFAQFFIFFRKLGSFRYYANRKIGISGVGNFYARKDLTDNQLHMLEVRRASLRSIDIRYSVYYVVLGFGFAGQIKQLSKINRTVGELGPAFYV